MRRLVGAWLGVAVLGLAGCGDGKPAASQEKLNKMQEAEQKQVDDDERAMQKQTKADSKKPK